MSGSVNVRALREWFVDLLAGDPAFDESQRVQVAMSWRGDLTGFPKRVYLTGVEPDGGTEPTGIRGGTKRYENRIKIGVAIDVAADGVKDPTDAEQVALELYDAMAALIADNVVPRDRFGNPLAYHVLLGDWSTELGPNDKGSGAILTSALRFHIDT